MNRTQTSILLAALPLALAFGCRGAPTDPTTEEPRELATEAPPTVEGEKKPTPEKPTETESEKKPPPDEPTETESEKKPPPDEPTGTGGEKPATKPGEVRLGTRKNGLRVLEMAARDGSPARISLWIEAGPARDRPGKPGLAVLSGRCLAESGQGGRDGEVLEETLARINGDLELSFEGRFVRVEASCPPQHAEDLARIVFRFVTQPRPAAEIIEKERQRLLDGLRAQRPARARMQDLRRLLGESVPTLPAEEAALARFDAGEVHLFIGLHYRPNLSLLGLELPPAAGNRDKTLRVFDDWESEVGLEPLSPSGEVIPVGFEKRDLPLAEVFAIVRSPAPEFSGLGATEVVWQLACLDGLGGPIRARLEAGGFSDVRLAVEDHDTGRNQTRSLVIHVPPKRVDALLDSLRAGFADLALAEPESRSLRIARERTRFLRDLVRARPWGRLRALARAVLHGKVDESAKLDEKIRRALETLRTEAIPQMARDRFVPVFLVRGPETGRPSDAAPLPAPRVPTEPSRTTARIQPIKGDAATLARLQERTLARAYQALGGVDALGTLEELSWLATCEFSASIPFRERWRVSLAEGTAVRERVILGTTIETRRDPDRAVEIIEGSKRTLSEPELAFFEVEATLHPTVLLATIVAQKAPVVLIGRVKVDGRTHLVMEWKGPHNHRVRFAVDEKNGLLRRIEYGEWQPKAAARRVILHVRHYVSVGRVRVPKLVKKYVEGEHRGDVHLGY